MVITNILDVTRMGLLGVLGIIQCVTYSAKLIVKSYELERNVRRTMRGGNLSNIERRSICGIRL
jgi:hypothetical protein